MTKKLLAMLLSVLLIVSVFAGCGKTGGTGTDGQDNQQNTAEPDNSENKGENGKVIFTDSCGREVELDSDITRIVPTGPVAQIALLAIAPEMYVGISSEWDDINREFIGDELLDLPLIGQLYGGKGEVNLEELANVNPQVVIDIGDSKDDMAEELDSIQEQIGIPCVHIDASLDTYPDAYRMLGELLGKEEEAEAIAVYCEEIISRAKSIVSEVGEENLANVIYCTGEDGLSVLAKTSFHAEIIDLLTNNVAVVDDVSSKGTGNPIDMEQLLLWDPDYIIFSPDGGYDVASGDETWQQLTAIKNGNYIETPMGPYDWTGSPPSVQRLLALIWLPAALYPDYVDYDMYEEVSQYFEIFYHHELTQDEYNALTKNAFIG